LTRYATEDAKKLSESLKTRGSELVQLKDNLVDSVWGDARPPRTKNPIFALEEKYTGESHTSKLARLRQELEKKEVHAIVLTALDEVAWFFNLRGSDIAYNPVFFAYAIITLDSEALFIQKDSAPIPDLLQSFGSDTEIHEYEEFWTHVAGLSEKLQGKVNGFALRCHRTMLMYL